MRIKIIGWVYIIFGIIFTMMLIYSNFKQFASLSQNHDVIGQAIMGEFYSRLYMVAILLIYYVVGVIWAFALIRHKRWSWYFGFCYMGLVIIHNFYGLESLTGLAAIAALVPLVGILFNLFTIYSLVVGLKSFLQNNQIVS